jgi:cell division septum initiation protein DivIVA
MKSARHEINHLLKENYDIRQENNRLKAELNAIKF